MRLLTYSALMATFTPLLLVGLVLYIVPGPGFSRAGFGDRLQAVHHPPLLSPRWKPSGPRRVDARTGPSRHESRRMALLICPFVWGPRLSGYVPALFEYPARRPTSFGEAVAARCEFFDQALLSHASVGAQVVILGAGWDTRAYGLLAGRSVDLFEVDAPATQAVKRAAIEKTGLDASRVNFVPCDFNRQSWLDALRDHGFDPDKRAVILWEGVTMYLEEHAIESTLRTVTSLPAGSCIAFDFFSREWLDSPAGKRLRRSVQAIYGEPWIFGFPVMPDFTGRLREELEKRGPSATTGPWAKRGRARCPTEASCWPRSRAEGRWTA
jgi:methyltransferase (TIGR00027 family)